MCNVGAAGSYRCVPDMSWFPLYDVIHVCTCTCPHTCIAVVSFTCNSWSSDPACDVIKKLQAPSMSVHVNFSMDDFDSAICCRYFNMHLYRYGKNWECQHVWLLVASKYQCFHATKLSPVRHFRSDLLHAQPSHIYVTRLFYQENHVFELTNRRVVKVIGIN